MAEPVAHRFHCEWAGGVYAYIGFSSAALTFVPSGSDPVHFEIGGQLPRQSIARGWTRSYWPEEFVAFAGFLLNRLESGDYPDDLRPGIRQTRPPTAP